MIKFGPSGNCEEFYALGLKHTEQSAQFVKDKGLQCFEYSFGMGFRMKEEKAKSIGQAFALADIEISVHAPYYINFANTTEEGAEKSYAYILESAKLLKLMGGKRCVFHSATQGKMQREEAIQLTKDRFKILRDLIYQNKLEDILYCPETMGKIAQIGTLEEVIDFCKIDNIFLPCIDFGHINAREQGSLKTVQDFKDRLEYMIAELGYERVKHFHVHFAKIQYGAKGEIRHLTFEDMQYGPEFYPLAIALNDLKLEPYIVSESAGTQAQDAITMQNMYTALSTKN